MHNCQKNSSTGSGSAGQDSWNLTVAEWLHRVLLYTKGRSAHETLCNDEATVPHSFRGMIKLMIRMTPWPLSGRLSVAARARNGRGTIPESCIYISLGRYLLVLVGFCRKGGVVFGECFWCAFRLISLFFNPFFTFSFCYIFLFSCVHPQESYNGQKAQFDCIWDEFWGCFLPLPVKEETSTKVLGEERESER